MNLEALRKHLATEVMGWKLISKEFIHTGRPSNYWFSPVPEEDSEDYPDGLNEMSESQWRPDENIEQAMMLLDNLPDKTEWNIDKSWNMLDGYWPYCVTVYDLRNDVDNYFEEFNEALTFEEFNEALTVAICLAVAKATGFEDE